MLNELNRCPVCKKKLGKNPVTFISDISPDSIKFYVKCKKCNFMGPFSKESEEAIKLWNELGKQELGYVK